MACSDAPTLRISPQRSLSLSDLPEELLERVLEDYIASLVEKCPGLATSPFPSPSHTPSASPSNSKRNSPCSSPSSSTHATPTDTPAASPTRSRPPSPVYAAAQRQPPGPASSTSTSCGLGFGLSTTTSASTTYQSSGVIFTMLVSRLFYRISSPLVYRSVTLSSRSQTQKLLEGSLRRHPERARWIRRLVVAGVWEGVGEVLSIIAASSCRIARGKGKGREAWAEADGGWAAVGLKKLEITIDAAALTSSSRTMPPHQQATPHGHAGSAPVPAQDVDANELCRGLLDLAGTENGLKELVVRKPQNVYLTHQRAKAIIGALAKVVESASALEAVHIAFRLSDDPVPPGSRRQGSDMASAIEGPIAALTRAVSLCSSLHTVTTHLPSIWNQAILRMSTNDALERIVLLGPGGQPVNIGEDGGAPLTLPVPASRTLPPNPVQRVYMSSSRGVDGFAAGVVRPTTAPRPFGMGTGLFITEAKKHERLCALIQAGSRRDSDQPVVLQPEPDLPFIPFGPPPPVGGGWRSHPPPALRLATVNLVPNTTHSNVAPGRYAVYS